MRTITIINWVIIALYLLYILMSYVETNRSGMDAAGRGMAMGFLLVAVVITAVLIVLNLIPVKWVRILGLVVGSIPVAVLSVNAIKYNTSRAHYAKQAKETYAFDDPHVKAIVEAIQKRNPTELKRLLEEDDSNINSLNVNNSWGPLEIAVQLSTNNTAKDKELVSLLLQHKADPNKGGLNHYATEMPFSVFKELLEAGADPNEKDGMKTSVLQKLVEHDSKTNFKKIKLLLEKGAKPTLPTGGYNLHMNYRLLDFAASQKAWKTCNLLLDNGADPNQKPTSDMNFWYHFEDSEKWYERDGKYPEYYMVLKNNERLVKVE